MLTQFKFHSIRTLMLHILWKLYLDPTVSLSKTTKIKPPTSIERKQKNMKWNKNFQNIYRVFMELRLRQQQTKFTRALRVHWHSDLQLFNHWAIIHSLRRAQFFKPLFFASQALCAQKNYIFASFSLRHPSLQSSIDCCRSCSTLLFPLESWESSPSVSAINVSSRLKKTFPFYDFHSQPIV